MIFAGAKIQNRKEESKSNNNESILDTVDDVSLQIDLLLQYEIFGLWTLLAGLLIKTENAQNSFSLFKETARTPRRLHVMLERHRDFPKLLLHELQP